MKKMLIALFCLSAGFLSASCSRTEDAYFKTTADTAKTESVADDLIKDGLYTGVILEYGGDSYYKIGAYSKAYDGKRGEALMNLNDGEETVTVYDYSYPSGFDMLNVNSYLFVNEHQFKDVIGFFNECGFDYTAVYSVPMQSSFVLSIADNKLRWNEHSEIINMNDELFLDAVNRLPEICRLCEEEPAAGRSIDIKQTGSDPEFDRTVRFYRNGDKYYMRVIHDDMPRDGVLPDPGKCYEIVSDEFKEILKSRFNSVNVLLRVRYGVNKAYY